MRLKARTCRLAGLVFALAFPWREARTQLRDGSRAPDIALRTLEGAPFRLSLLRGSPVVLTFWGTWCPPCREEFPALADAHRKHQGAGLRVVAVNQRDQELATTDVQKFVQEFSVPFTVVLDPRGRSRREYRLVGLPTTVFIDSAGRIVHTISGPVSRAQLANGLTAIGIPR